MTGGVSAEDRSLTWKFCARKCMRPGSWVAAAKEPLCHSKEMPLSHRGRAVPLKVRDVVREIEVTS